jgi:hypothetical protein
LLAAGDYLRHVASEVSLEETDKCPNLRSLLKGVAKAVEKGLQEPRPSPHAAQERPVTAVLDKIPEAAAVLTDPRWAFAVADFINTWRSAMEAGRGYRSRSEYVRRHRAKP